MKMKKWFVRMAVLFTFFTALSVGGNVIQTQPSTDGNWVLSLLRAQVKDKVLTFQVLFKNISTRRRTYGFYFKDVYYTDSKSKNKYFALRDTNGNYIAGPAYDRVLGGGFRITLDPGGKQFSG
jgi:hypothetical protein